MYALLLAALMAAAPPSEPKLEASRPIRHLLVVWREAWERQDLELFLRCYAEDFRAGGRDKAALGEHKRRVFARTNEAQVTMEDIRLEALPDGRIAVSFEQTYVSDIMQDRGLKTLILAPRNERWLIVDEQFEALRD
jgi:hypothetical protein